jgi:hypothetical protein
MTPQRPCHVAIVGSRHLTDYRQFCSTIRPLIRPDDVIVSGAADGIDSLARRYANQNGHALIEHPVDQSLVSRYESEGMDRRAAYGRAAHERNQLIVDDSDRMIAILCEHSKGTPNSLHRMRTKLGIDGRTMDIRVVSYLWPCDR